MYSGSGKSETKARARVPSLLQQLLLTLLPFHSSNHSSTKESYPVIVIPVLMNRDTQVSMMRHLRIWLGYWLASATVFPHEEPSDINKRKQRTYIFKDCTFDGTSMVITGGAGSMDDTMVFHNSNTGRTFCVHGGMDTETFLREFSGKRK